MADTTEILRIDEPHFTIRVYESMLRIDLKGSVKNEIEDALENTPVLKETLGKILAMFVPLHVRLSDIDSVQMDTQGKITIKLPRHRDIVTPLDPKDAKKLVDKLNELIPKEKEKELKRIIKEQRLQKIENVEQELGKERFLLPTGGAQFPITEPPGVLKKEKEAAEEEEK
jgi:hypothetical protein